MLAHGGELPGFTTAVYVTAVRWLAVTVLVNANPQEGATGLVVLRILYDVLGIEQLIEVGDRQVDDSAVCPFKLSDTTCSTPSRGHSSANVPQMTTTPTRPSCWTSAPGHPQTPATA